MPTATTAYRAAVVEDVPAVRALFDDVFPIRYEDGFYRLFAEGLQRGSLSAGKPCKRHLRPEHPTSWAPSSTPREPC